MIRAAEAFSRRSRDALVLPALAQAFIRDVAKVQKAIGQRDTFLAGRR
jgi:hypothetical protein